MGKFQDGHLDWWQGCSTCVVPISPWCGFSSSHPLQEQVGRGNPRAVTEPFQTTSLCQNSLQWMTLRTYFSFLRTRIPFSLNLVKFSSFSINSDGSFQAWEGSLCSQTTYTFYLVQPSISWTLISLSVTMGE